MGGKDVFVRAVRLWKIVASMESQWLGVEVDSGGGRNCCRIGLIGYHGETWS